MSKKLMVGTMKGKGERGRGKGWRRRPKYAT
jgi:hypothetical protein